MSEDYQTPAEESRFLAHARGGSNLLLTGSAGTGKSWLLRQFIAEERAAGRDPAVCASTGIASLNIGGATIHRWAGIQLGAADGEEFEAAAWRLERKGRSYTRAADRIREARTLVLDEISMLPGRQVDFLDFWFRRQRGENKPWGGLQTILVGDFLQLPPVRTDGRPYDWAFTSKLWESGGAVSKTILLEQIRRQDEPDLVLALQAARVGALSGRAADILMARVLNFPPGDRPRLLTHNAQVDKWCDYKLGDLEGEEVVLDAETEGDPMDMESLAKNILAPEHLRLKLGARVMNLVNRDCAPVSGPVPIYVANGQVGIVRDFTEGAVHVEFSTPAGTENVWVSPFTWSWSHNPPSRGGPSFTQYPLRLAYALTIHKAQGLTLDEAHIDIRAAREPGQAYVALSRVRTLAGLSLKDWPSGIFVSPEGIAFYRGLHPGANFAGGSVVASVTKPDGKRSRVVGKAAGLPAVADDPELFPVGDYREPEPDVSWDECGPAAGSTGGANPYARGSGSREGKSNYTGD